MAQAASRTTDKALAVAIPASHTRPWHVITERAEDAGLNRHDSFAELKRKLRAGDQDGATEVFQHFVHRLREQARSTLDIRILPSGEISERLGLSDSTVRRVRKRIEKEVQRMQADATYTT
jgi:hypothetical protein